MNIVSRTYKHLFAIWRPRRMNKFIALVAPRETDTLLDVGGYPYFWEGSPIKVAKIDILNLHPVPAPEASRPTINTIVGDGCALQFADKSYDIVFSNSVIEHVGTLERQVMFAKEAIRVGKRLWIQTPAFVFPVEPHCLALFIHWLPWKLRKHLLRFTPVIMLGKVEWNDFYKTMESTRMLTRKEFSGMFPGCSIYTERLFGIIPKSYVAYKT